MSSRELFGGVEGAERYVREGIQNRVKEMRDEPTIGYLGFPEWACGDAIWAEEGNVAEVKEGGPTERGIAAKAQ